MSANVVVYRFSGSGNTFFIIEGEIVENRATLAKKLCLSEFSFQTDGALFLDSSAQADFKWDFYNQDGSFAEMCGNAARCVGLYIKKKYHKSEVSIETAKQNILISSTDNNKFKVLMPKAHEQQTKEEHFFINTGVPHWVVEGAPDKNKVKKLRPLPASRGSNVTFLQNKNNSWFAVSFERGVENFTKSCGTGAVAAAAYLLEKGGHEKSVIQMPGGTLEVSFTEAGPVLCGEAELQFTFKKVIDG